MSRQQHQELSTRQPTRTSVAVRPGPLPIIYWALFWLDCPDCLIKVAEGGKNADGALTMMTFIIFNDCLQHPGSWIQTGDYWENI